MRTVYTHANLWRKMTFSRDCSFLGPLRIPSIKAFSLGYAMFVHEFSLEASFDESKIVHAKAKRVIIILKFARPTSISFDSIEFSSILVDASRLLRALGIDVCSRKKLIIA